MRLYRFDYEKIASLEDPKKIASALAGMLRMHGITFTEQYPFMEEVEDFVRELSGAEIAALQTAAAQQSGKKVQPVGQSGDA